MKKRASERAVTLFHVYDILILLPTAFQDCLISDAFGGKQRLLYIPRRGLLPFIHWEDI